VGAELTRHPGAGQRGEEAGRTVEVRHLHVGGAHAGRVMGVGTRAAGQREPLRQAGRPRVQRLVGDFRVEDLDDVRCPVRAQAGKQPAQAGPRPGTPLLEPALIIETHSNIG
jgi:hypothetical protein